MGHILVTDMRYVYVRGFRFTYDIGLEHRRAD